MMESFFTLQEMIQSEVAEKYNIDNRPNVVEANNINSFINGCLNPMRAAWAVWCKTYNLGTPAVIVTSGFRSILLNKNKEIGGSSTSVHLLGFAADLVPKNGQLMQFRRFMETYMKTVKFDQCIFEKIDKDGKPRWIHIGWYNNRGEQRCHFMEYKNGKYTIIKV